ncbi:glutathione S-transferase family protein [Psychromonas sp. KJ10-10]|uniref:glutathione S-transferase family protein n=1 Tax=Psychromonas sp. KJ10-10 TaxID=3391823 RepID=UPI0039B3A9C2
MIISKDRITTTEVQSWTGLHLLHSQGSSCSQKVRILLGELNQPWTAHAINLRKQENSSRWYLGINPHGVVPALVDNGTVHVESNDILAYLDQNYATENRFFFKQDCIEASEAKALLDLEKSLHIELRILTIQFGPVKLKSENEIDEKEQNGDKERQSY